MSILSTICFTTALAGSICSGTLPENCDIFQSGKVGNVGYIINCTSTDCDKLIQDILNSCGKPSAPSTPETETPDIEMPDVEIPDSETPEIETPEVETPETETPEIEIPEIETPEIEAPEIEAPETETPETEAPDYSGSEETTERSLAEQVVDLVNEERIAAGLNPLTINESAMSAALVRAKEIKQSFSHTRPNGSSFSTALKEQGVSFRGSGENIAYGQRSPEAVMKAWMNSSGHRANILNAKYTSIGVGCYEVNGVLYWTQLFIY